MNINKAAASATFALTALALIAGACGGSGYGDAADQTAEPTLAAAPSATAEATVEAAPSSTAVAAPATRLTLVASSVRFEQTSLTAPAGAVTIAFDNRDEGIPHNVHVFGGGDASGRSIASTEIETGAAQQMLELGELAAGAYFYQCDVHPSQMIGTLTVS